MPHRRSPEALKHQRERYQKYLLNYVIPEQNRPRYNVAATFTLKHERAVTLTSNNPSVMKHQRKAVGVCICCGSDENLHVHHIDKNRCNNLPENLLVLCAKCHKKEHLELNLKCPTAINVVQKNSENAEKNLRLLNKEKKKPIQYGV